MTNQNRTGEYIELAVPVITDKRTLTCKFKCSPGIEKVFKYDYFHAFYESVDLSNVSESLLIIPALANLAPIAWALNAKLYVQKLDLVYFNALKEVKKSFQNLYPQLSWEGEIVPETIVKAPGYPSRKSALLFSGGVDSLTSYAVHKKEKPLLVSAIGTSRGSEKYEQRVKEFSAFASKHGVKHIPVNTNLNSLFNGEHLPFGGGGWWMRVQHGMAFLGMCAPLSPVEQIGKIYLASSHTKESGISWGSHHSIDNHVAWASTTVQHDCENMSRQEKVHILSKFINEEDNNLKIKVCLRGANRTNCSQCNKCCRTIIGLAAEGVNPNLHGFHFDTQKLAHIKENLSNRNFLRNENNRYMWKDIQKHLPTSTELNIKGLEKFFAWLKNFKIS